MKDVNGVILGICEECFEDVSNEIRIRKEALSEENKFLALMLKVTNSTMKLMKLKSKGGKSVLPRSLHAIFLRQYLGRKPKDIMAIYGLDKNTYYNCIKIVQQLTLTSECRDKFSELFTAYPKLLEDHTKDYNETTFGKGNSKSKENAV